ncbi:MAG TPA: YdcF family protein [Marinagarivorans sp.]
MTSMQNSAQVVWDYLAIEQPLERADGLLVLGNNDTRTADYAAALMQQGWAKWLCFSGGYGRLSRTTFTRPEAETFADIALAAGVPEQHMLVEPQAANTGENIRFARALFDKRGIALDTLLITTKPYLQRRALATCLQQWPAVSCRAAPVPLLFYRYANCDISEAAVLDGLIGEMQRILEYPAKGFMVEQAVPDTVMAAYRELCGACKVKA